MADKIDMKRKWNWPIWIGFVFVVAGLLSYNFFARFPVTRDFPWANLSLLGIGTLLLIVGSFRAFGRPQLYRGKIFGSVFTAIAVFLFAFFSYEIFTSCGRCQHRQAPRELAKKRRTSFCLIKTKSRLAWAICFPARERSR